MSRTDLKVDVLGEAVHLSRAQLYRKVKALTDLSPSDLIRQLRLEKAAHLLEPFERECFGSGNGLRLRQCKLFRNLLQEAIRHEPR